MKTTLDIDDDVLAAAIELASRQRTTAGKVISRLARRTLTGAAGAALMTPGMADRLSADDTVKTAR